MKKPIIIILMIVLLCSFTSAINCDVWECTDAGVYSWADFSNPIPNGSTVSDGQSITNGGWSVSGTVNYEDTQFNVSPVGVLIPADQGTGVFHQDVITSLGSANASNASCIDFYIPTLPLDASDEAGVIFPNGARFPEWGDNGCGGVNRINICYTRDAGATVIPEMHIPINHWTTFCIYWNGTTTIFHMDNGTDQIYIVPIYTPWTSANPLAGGTNFQIHGISYSGDYFIDNIRFFNYTTLGDKGITAAPPSVATSTPTIIHPSPANNANNNTNQTFNVSHPTTNNDVRYYLYFGTSTPLAESDLIYDNVTRNGSEFSQWTTNVGDGIYYWKWRVQNTTNGAFSLNTTERTWTLDTVSPTITLGNNNNFSSDNTTIISNYLRNLSIDISFFDTNLYQTLINITNEDGESVWQRLNTSITGTTVNFSETINISNFPIGDYIVKLIATDSHTAQRIDPYDVKTGLSYFRYTTKEGNIIKIISDTLPLTKKTTKFKDRYTFDFNYLFQKDTYKFIIESYNKITYLPSSEHPAHFVIWGDNMRGNWLDFGGINKKDITVTKIDDYIYEVEITANGIKNFKFSSLGGLNTVEEHYLLRIGAVIDMWVYDEDNPPDQINATVSSGTQYANSTINTSGARLVNITQEITEITLTSNGFGTEIKTVSITSSYHNFTFNMTPVSATKLYFYDEKSETLIEGETFSVYLETTGFSNIYSATTNPYTIKGLPDGLFDLKASSANYPEREYKNLNISNITTTLLNIYLINTTLSAEKTFYVRGSSVNAIEDVKINFTRVINGTITTIAEENTDYDGAATLYLDENYEYGIIFSKSGYDTKTINLVPINDEYIITLILTAAQYNVSVYEGLRYSFSPSNTLLNNNTKYNFTFTLNSSEWLVTNCTLRLKNGSNILNQTSSNTANSCFLRIEYFIGDVDNVTSEATYEFNSIYNFTIIQQYRIIYTYEGEFSLKNFLDDLSDFSMAGFDSFGRMMLAFIVIFIILILAGRETGFENKEILIIMFIALVGFFSFINWFYLDWAGMPEVLGLKKYFIFYLMVLVGAGYMFNKMRK